MKVMNRVAIAAVLLGCSLSAGTALAQGKTSSPPTWNPTRTADGQPDIAGYWAGSPAGGSLGAAQFDIQEGYPPSERLLQSRNGNGAPPPMPKSVVDPPIPYQPWAKALYDQNKKNSLNPTKLEQIDSYSRCLQTGVPRQNLLGSFQILQPPGFVVMVYPESHNTARIIALDGRPHLDPKIKLWAGDSVGHWEGNTLVVDVTNLNEYAFYDWAGNFHSDELHLIERWTFLDANTIDYEVINDDPRVFTKPWKIENQFIRNSHKDADAELFEAACYENEHDVNVMLQPDKADASSK